MLTLNGLPVLGARLCFPRTGAWHADLRVDTPDPITGPVTIDVDDGRAILKGTVSPGGNWQNVGYLRVIGGAAGLRKIAPAKHYTSASLRVVIGDLLASAGEKLSSTVDAAAASAFMQSWTTVGISTGRLITQALRSAAPGATWRVLPDGTVWFGKETWPDSGLLEDDDYQILTEEPSKLFAKLGVEVPLLRPGTTLGGRKVSYVEHRFGDPETRTEVWFEASDAGSNDRLRAAIKGLVGSAFPSMEYSALFWATIVSQKGDRIDVRPIDTSRPPMAGVPLLAGLAKWDLQLVPGGHVLVGWGGGDPTQSFVIGFGNDVFASSVGIECPSVTIGTAADAQPAILSTPYLSAEGTYLDALATAVQALLSALTLIPQAAALSAAQAAFHAAALTFTSKQVRHS